MYERLIGTSCEKWFVCRLEGVAGWMREGKRSVPDYVAGLLITLLHECA